MINRKKSATVDSETTQSWSGAMPCVIPLRSMGANGEPGAFREVETASLMRIRQRKARANGQWTWKMKIPVPTGISATNSSIGRWFKRVGEPVTIADPLVEVESDNITVGVLAPATGVLSKILLGDGHGGWQHHTRIDYRVRKRYGGNKENNRRVIARSRDGISYLKTSRLSLRDCFLRRQVHVELPGRVLSHEKAFLSLRHPASAPGSFWYPR
jgi:hypothetical protein